MTIVEPDLVMTKTGPLSADVGVPETFTLDVHNTGGSPAYAVTLTDLLPNDADGGMCDVPPQNITAQVFEADGTTPVSPVLAEGADFTTSFAGDPTCSLTLSMQSSDTTGVDQRLIVTFEAQVDVGTLDNAVLTNVAGATEWDSKILLGPSWSQVHAQCHRWHGRDARPRRCTHDDGLRTGVCIREIRRQCDDG